MKSKNGSINSIKVSLANADYEAIKIQYENLNLELLSLAELVELADLLTRSKLLTYSKDCWARATLLAPNVAEIRNNFGLVLSALKNFDEAQKQYQEAIKLKNNFGQAYYNLATLSRQQGNYSLAIQSYEDAIASGFIHAKLFLDFSTSLFNLAEYSKAISVLRKSLSLFPANKELKFLLAQVLSKSDFHKEAIEILKQLENDSDRENEVFNLLGVSLSRVGELSLSEKYFKKVKGDPEIERMASANLAACQISQGLIKEGLDRLHDLVKVSPDMPKFHSLLCMSSCYDQRLDNQELKNLHLAFNNYFKPAIKPVMTKKAKIRIAYVSADFRQHSISYFMKDLFSNLDKNKYEVTVYSDAKRHDFISDWFRDRSDSWHLTSRLNDQQLVEKIRADKQDIVVDLAGHTEGSRLTCFAQGLGNIQVSYLGYPCTTGLSAIDYRITDKYCDPSGYEDQYSEKLIRLNPSFICYSPVEQSPQIGRPAFESNGYITFASFNTWPKINDLVIETWSKILKAVPESKLLLKAWSFADQACIDKAIAKFENFGVSASSLKLIQHEAKWFDHMQKYQEVDIALDPFPYNGTTTTFEAIYMGVPVLTLEGHRHSARVGYSINKNLRLDQLIATNLDAYIAAAVQLAKDTYGLKEFKKNLRSILTSSALCDGANFSKDFYSQLSELS